MQFWQTIVAAAAALGMAVMLYFMERSDRGVPGLVKLDKTFKLPDMRFRYTPDILRACFDGLGENGRAQLQSVWRMDYAFIACFWLVMFLAPLNVAKEVWLRAAMQIAATLRAVLDVCENLLLSRCCRKHPSFSDRMAKTASAFTSVKFIMLGLWLVALFGSLLTRSLGL